MNCINLPEFRVIKAEENEFDYRFTVETIEDKFWEQHKENIYLIYKYYQEHSSGIMANANKILEKINNSNNNLL